jgi:hypothetical protein
MAEATNNDLPVECRFAFHIPGDGVHRDMHFVKKVRHLPDGTRVPEKEIVYDYQRPYWVVKQGHRTFKQKREWIEKDKCVEFNTTQTDLVRNAASSLKTPWFRGSLRDLNNSPYLFGTDISSTALIKADYKAKHDVLTPYTYCASDTETDVIHGHGRILMQNVCMHDKVYCAVDVSFLQGMLDPLPKIYKVVNEYLGEDFKKANVKLEIEIVDSEIEAVRRCVNKLHEWMPDFVATHNLLFDMEKMIAACERAGVDPADIFCDPSIPKNRRRFQFKIGPAKKVTASGRVMTYKWTDRWHTVDCPATFYWMCSGGAYRRAREGGKEETSYSLDHLLKKTIGRGKIRHPQAEHLDGLDWHKFMQSKLPLDYIAYHLFDSYGMILMDQKTMDLALSIPTFAAISDFSKMTSQPRRTVDRHHVFLLREKNAVVGTTGSEVKTEDDELTVSPKGWITALEAENILDNGLQCIEENPNLRTNIRPNSADLDVEGAYPTNDYVAGTSKRTTRKELISVEGHRDEVVRRNTINLSGGHVNANQFCEEMLNFPSTLEVLRDYLLARENS